MYKVEISKELITRKNYLYERYFLMPFRYMQQKLIAKFPRLIEPHQNWTVKEYIKLCVDTTTPKVRYFQMNYVVMLHNMFQFSFRIKLFKLVLVEKSFP